MPFQYKNEDGEIELTNLSALNDTQTLEVGKPREGSTCSFRILTSDIFSTGHNQTNGGINLADSKYLSTQNESNPPSIAVSIGLTSVSELDRLLDVCLTRLHVGEVGNFVIKCSRSKFCCELTLELLSITNSEELYALNTERIVAVASSLKEQGVELFSKGFTIDAFYKFSKATKYMCLLDPTSASAHASLASNLRSNMASCHVKVENWEDAIDLCNMVLHREPDNVKALYRRGWSYIEIQEYEKAGDDLIRAKKLEPENQAVLKKLAVLVEKKKALNTKYAQAMKKFLS